jgi:methyl coenzyme M reductase subunit C
VSAAQVRVVKDALDFEEQMLARVERGLRERTVENTTITEGFVLDLVSGVARDWREHVLRVAGVPHSTVMAVSRRRSEVK